MSYVIDNSHLVDSSILLQNYSGKNNTTHLFF